MQPQSILRMLIAILSIRCANAEIRSDFEFKIKYNKNLNDTVSEHEIINILKSWDITTDEFSEIYIHKENNYINFSCFDCVISNIPNNEEIQHSNNWRVEK